MKNVLLLLFVFLNLIVLSQNNVGIGTNSPHSSAKLDIRDTTKGLLIPRMNTIQRNAIISPANGLLVYDNDSLAFMYFNGTIWKKLFSDIIINNDWTKTGNSGTNSSINFIGTTDSIDLVFKNNNNQNMRLFANGSWLVGDSLQGVGNKSLYDNTKGAFRTGSVNILGPRNWDRDSLGFNSFASGTNTKAKGTGSFAAGFNSNATATNATTFGNNTNASGTNSFAIGSTTTASGLNSIALGINTTASGAQSFANGTGSFATGTNSTALGNNSFASGTNAIASGSNASASGNFSIAMGDIVTASGNNSIALGSSNTATNTYTSNIGGFNNIVSGLGSTNIGGQSNQSTSFMSVTMGEANTASGGRSMATNFFNTASGDNSTSMGYKNTAKSIGEMVVGIGATNYTPSINGNVFFQTVNANDRLFVIGNAIDSNANNSVDSFERSNAFVVLKNGNTAIGNITPTSKLDVNGKTKTIDFQMTNGAGANKILQSDASGNATWDSLTASDFNAWSTIGNTGTNPSTNFIGTTDSIDLVFKNNNNQNMRLFANGSWLIGDTIQGLGNKTFFDNTKAAFRTGRGLRQWDKDSIGSFSFASGFSTKAKGYNSTAMGSSTNAYGFYSTAFGFGSDAFGDYSTAMGYNTSAEGIYATALGENTDARGDWAVSMGKSNEAFGDYSLVVGQNNRARGDYSISTGYFSNANGTGSTTIGNRNDANGDYSIALGSENSALSYGEIVLGIGAKTYTSSINGDSLFGIVNSTDRLFVIGNAIDSNLNTNVDFSERSNAMVVLKNGNTAIGNITPTSKLDVDGKTKTINFQMTTGAGANRILQSDASGNASWVNPTSIVTNDSQSLSLSDTILSISRGNSINLSSIIPSETDPQVSSTTTNRIPRWNGSTLTDGIIQDDATNIGIGTAPVIGQKVTVNGKTTTTNFQMTNGAGANRYLKSSALGNATWDSITANEVNAWGLTGNTGTNAATNFIGTTNNVDLVFKNNNNQNMRLFVDGSWLIGDSLQGIGAKTFFDNTKSAFRTGEIDASMARVWDKDSLGLSSFASGYGTKAKGIVSTAMGIYTNAMGIYSTAMGGYTEANGLYSTAMGVSTKANGDYSTAFGSSNNANGVASTAFGSSNNANHFFTTAMGNYTNANGALSTSMGLSTIANGYSALVIGLFNDTIVSPQNLPSSATPLFIIGNGTTSSARKNAVVVQNDGDFGINNNNPLKKLHILGDGGKSNATSSTDAEFVLEETGDDLYISILTDTNQESGYQFGNQFNGAHAGIYYNTGANTYDMRFRTNGDTTRMTIDKNGQVGIGTTTPMTTLHQDEGTATSTYHKFTANTTTGTAATDGFDIGITATGVAEIRQRENLNINLFTNNIQRMTLDFDGQLGIGTGAPNSRLETTGSFAAAIVTTSANITLTESNHTVILTGGTPIVTLPAASTCTRRIYYIVNNSGGLRTISSFLSFGGVATTTINSAAAITIQSDGTNWYRIQ